MDSTGQELFSEQAWLRMRIEFKELEPSGAVHRDAMFWRSQFDHEGIDPDAQCKVGHIKAVNVC